ncbi:SGNH hydrolase-type esterase domain-containing protein [Pilobolus umbonatus]|nr:SGNH hydrolase-type esterase domain-containing protein [Pilobolus umbonatus]
MVKILCFGDSITWGYYNFGTGKHPYSLILSEYLNSHYEADVEVIESGCNGERVRRDMEDRLSWELSSNEYDYVILLGGLNDIFDVLINRCTVLDIMNSFRNMYDVLDRNSRVKKFFHITLPYCRSDNIEKCKTIKDNINTYIKFLLHSTKRYTIDITDHEKYMFNYMHLNEEHRDKYWNDNLHFYPEGYDKLGKCVFEAFTESINKGDI